MLDGAGNSLKSQPLIQESILAKLKSFDPTTLKHKRRQSQLNQSEYWIRYGITQSGGSRYETGRTIPLPASMLIWLHEAGRITDQDLADALRAVTGNSKAKP
jgi:hypothetical protein